jgi:hypothetical protein
MKHPLFNYEASLWSGFGCLITKLHCDLFLAERLHGGAIGKIDKQEYEK